MRDGCRITLGRLTSTEVLSQSTEVHGWRPELVDGELEFKRRCRDFHHRSAKTKHSLRGTLQCHSVPEHDGGVSWNAVNSGLTSLFVASLTLDPQDPHTAREPQAASFASNSTHPHSSQNFQVEGGKNETLEFGSNNRVGFLSDCHRAPAGARVIAADTGHLTGLRTVLHWKFLDVSTEQWCSDRTCTSVRKQQRSILGNCKLGYNGRSRQFHSTRDIRRRDRRQSLTATGRRWIFVKHCLFRGI